MSDDVVSDVITAIEGGADAETVERKLDDAVEAVRQARVQKLLEENVPPRGLRCVVRLTVVEATIRLLLADRIQIALGPCVRPLLNNDVSRASFGLRTASLGHVGRHVP
jgi:hypothetical protein